MDLYVSIMGDKNLLFRNKGNLEFEEVGEKAGVQAPLVSFSTAAFDYNNDGNTDLYVGLTLLQTIRLPMKSHTKR